MITARNLQALDGQGRRTRPTRHIPADGGAALGWAAGARQDISARGELPGMPAGSAHVGLGRGLTPCRVSGYRWGS